MKLSGSILARTAWFLDYDGSVCPHQEVWEERTYNPEEIYGFVTRLAAKAASVQWNTGRRPESLGGVHPGFLERPGYFIQGSVHWDPVAKLAKRIGPDLPPGIADIFETALEKYPELRLEVKPTGLRVAPVQTGTMARVAHFAEATRDLTPVGWTWMVGHRGTELMADGYDKARALVEEMPKFPAGTLPVVVGDDIPDRPAFIEALARGGFVIPVGDACGWVTELKHRPDQVVFCENPSRVQALVERLLA